MDSKPDHDNKSTGDVEITDDARREQSHHSIRMIVGIISGIMIWLAASRLSELYINTKSVQVQTTFYLILMLIFLGILFWLGRNYPECVGMAKK